MSGQILIVDGMATNRIVLKVKLNAASHEVVQAGSVAEALRLVGASVPRLVLASAALPDLPGVELCRRLRAAPATAQVPVVLIATAADAAARHAALAAGADEVLVRPLNEMALMARIRGLLRSHQADMELQRRAETCRDFGLAEAAEGFQLPPRVALVAPDAAAALGWRAALCPHLPGDFRPLTASAALAGAGQPGAPDLYLIAADLAEPGAGLRLIADLRARIGGHHAGLCLASLQPWAEQAALALDLGANAVVPLPLDGAETALRLRRLLARQRRTEALGQAVREGLQLAATDPLTGLWNRRYALAHLDRVAAQALTSGGDFAVMVLDLDRFKAINDRHGHAAGDIVLHNVATRLQRGLRPSDLVARIGGEEFLVVLPDTPAEAARSVADRLCRAIATAPIPLPGVAGGITVTISAGLALLQARAPAAAEVGAPAARDLAQRMLERADAALFAAKHDGRNQVTVASAA
jgi:two-component system cell cycle response regulator